MDRTQSIMRIATTASPVSGSDVRHKILEIAGEAKLVHAIKKIQVSIRLYRWKVRATRPFGDSPHVSPAKLRAGKGKDENSDEVEPIEAAQAVDEI